MQQGIVKWFNSAKGYGFITPGDGGRDLFVHYTDILAKGYRNLEQGQKVTFEYADGPKGPHATQVQLDAFSAASADQASQTVVAEEAMEQSH